MPVDTVDERLANLCARRPLLRRGDFWRLVDALLDTRNYLTNNPPDTGNVPTREALDGSTRTTAGPERSPA